MNPRTCWLLLALGGVSLPSTAFGAEPGAAALPRPSGAESAASWNLSVQAQGFAVDEAAVRTAVARELARADVPAGTQPIQIQVAVAQGGNLSVSYRNPAGAELSRSVTAPARADEVPEASALLVGNLARDEASALIASLENVAQAKADAAPPSLIPSAAARAPAAPGELPPELPLDSLNLSLFHPLTLRSATEQRHLACELGLFYSRTAALSGLSLTFLGVTRVDGPASGVQVGLFGYWHGGPGEGVRLGGLFGASEGRFVGLSAATLTTVHRGELVGAELSVLASIATGPLEGVQAAGVFSYADSVAGVQLASVASLSAGPVAGAQIATLASVAGDVQGLQLSVINVGGSVHGTQIGVINVAQDVTGLQLGVVNVARSVKGQSLGFVPYNREGGVQIVSWYNSNEPFNVGLRFHAGALYAMPTLAFDPGSAVLVTESGARYAPGWSLGLRLPLDRAYLDLDANYSQRSLGWDSVADNIDLRYRALVGWRILRGFAAFAGGGVRHHVITNGPGNDSLEPELSLGMELL